LFFASWAALGTFILLQIIPLDNTVCEAWFYFPLAGILGMLGVVLGTFKIRPKWILFAGMLLVLIFGARTAVRGLDWKNPYKLAQENIKYSPDDFVSYSALSYDYLQSSNYQESKIYAEKSISIYPYVVAYVNLGSALGNLGDYAGAYSAYIDGTKLAPYYLLYDNIAALTLVYGSPDSDRAFIQNALQAFPTDPVILTYWAVWEAAYNDNSAAQATITKAARYGQVPGFIYDSIMANKPFTIFALGKYIKVR
jgi:tetratricopeptide (TPR) repeat protein